MPAEASHEGQLPRVIDTLEGALQRRIKVRHVQSVELGRRLRDVVTPLADNCRKQAKAPPFSAWPESAAQALGGGLTAMGSALATDDVFYLSFTWGFLRPIRLDPSRDLAHAIDLARSWAQECAVCSANGRDGFWLEYWPPNAAGEATDPFELVVWGAWQDLSRRLLPFELSAREA
jgi:hypothetical protein